MAEADPYTQIINRIWDLIEGADGTDSLVKAGNRAKVRFKGQVVKVGDAPSDSVELSIRPAPGGGAQLRATTDASRFIANFTIAAVMLGTDPTKLFPLKWHLVKLFAKAGPDMGLPSLCSKVTFPDLSEFPDTAPPGAPEPSSVSWSSFMSVSVEFWRPTSSLIS